jgi:hypothetical protein
LHHIIPEVPKTTILEAVTEKLGYRKLCARWVPKMLTDDHKMKLVGSARGCIGPSAVQSGPAPSDFSLFLPIKKHLAGTKFDNDDEVQEEVMTWFLVQAADFCDSWMQKLVPGLNKCLDIASDCVEK